MDTDQKIIMLKRRLSDGKWDMYEGFLIGDSTPKRIVGLRWVDCVATMEMARQGRKDWMAWGPHWVALTGKADAEVLP